MLILAISTSSKTCSVALLENEICLKELNILNEKTHSENLVPLIDELLICCNKKINDVELIACDNGPGSFTGIRIGISTVKAIAEVNKIPVVTCSSLEALSYNISNPDKNICSLIDARNNQVYCGIFNTSYKLIGTYLADDINNILELINKNSCLYFVGDGALIHNNLLNGNIIKDNNIHAKNIGICGYNKFKNGCTETADSISPMYLRPSQAERMKNSNG